MTTLSWSPINLDLWTWWVFAFAIAASLSLVAVMKLLDHKKFYPRMPGWVPAALAVAGGFTLTISAASAATGYSLDGPGFAGPLILSMVLGIVELFISFGFGIAWERNL